MIIRSLAIARSHSLAGEVINALALTKHAQEQCKKVLPVLSGEAALPEASAPSIAVTKGQIEALDNLLAGELERSRALAEISNLRKAANASGDKPRRLTPLVERLSDYPSEGVDLENIVTYPPKLEPIPVKPIFLDVAWNYIQYPDKQDRREQISENRPSEATQEAKPQKRGWFGFGR